VVTVLGLGPMVSSGPIQAYYTVDGQAAIGLGGGPVFICSILARAIQQRQIKIFFQRKP